MIGFDLTGGEKADAPHFVTLLDIGPDITPRAAMATRAIPARQTAPPHEPEA